MPKKDEKAGNGMINFYEHKDIKKHLTVSHNPHLTETQIKLPCRVGVVAASGGGKSNFMLNCLSKMSDTFGHVYICIPNGGQEPLYQFLLDKVGAKNVTFFKRATEIPPMAKFPHSDKQILLIFDDMVNATEPEQMIMREWFLRGRKVGKGVSMFFLSQSYFKISKFIRLQFNYLVLLKLSSMRDMSLIMSDYSLGVQKEELLAIYKDATKLQFGFLKIDVDARNNNLKYSRNFTQFYHVDDEDEDEDEN